MPLVTVGCADLQASDQASPVTTAGRMIALTETELDGVSAAGVGVDVETMAFATGQFGQTATDLVTGIVANGPVVIGYGFGVGEAIACCGPDAEVRLGTSLSGTGDYVFQDSFTAYGDHGGLKSGVTNGLVLALSGLPREVLAAATRDYISKVHMAPPRFQAAGRAPVAQGVN